MSDPRWNIKDKRLPRVRQDGYATGDTVDPDTETKRRLRDIADAATVKPDVPFARTVKPDTSATPIPTTPVDRWHKKSLSHITVSKHDFDDPELEASRFSTVQAAITYADTVIVPLLTNADVERIVIEVHDGLYEEDLLMNSGNYDIEGVGRPTIFGNHRLIQGTTSRILLRDIELLGKDTVDQLPALYIDVISDYPASERTLVEIDRCYIHGPWGGIYSAGTRPDIARCVIETDFLDTDYTNIDFPAIELLQTVVGYAEIRDSYISGLLDFRAPVGAAGWPNYGMAIKLTGADSDWAKTGAAFRNCTVTGYCVNLIWNGIFDHCDLYGGKKHVTAGTVFSFLQGDSDTGVFGAWTFDHCGIASRYICEEFDLTNNGAGPYPPCTNIYIQHTKQLSYDTYDTSNDPLGSTVVSNNVFTNLYGFFTFGNTYAIMSITWRSFWNAVPGPAEGAISTRGSFVAEPIASLVCDYIHW